MTDAVKTEGLRASRVVENEERMLQAARALFVERGYQATTLAAVAQAAGVAPRTVYVRFGTKAALLKKVVDVAVAGDLKPIDVAHREWYLTAVSAPTLDERIVAFAKGSTRLLASAADVIAVAVEAAATEPTLAAAGRAGRAATRDSVHGFWSAAAEAGLLPDHCDLRWLSDTTSALAQAETYLLMRETLGTTPRRYRTWLATTWQRMAYAGG
jgi:AcrR family transcriptional regulator